MTEDTNRSTGEGSDSRSDPDEVGEDSSEPAERSDTEPFEPDNGENESGADASHDHAEETDEEPEEIDETDEHQENGGGDGESTAASSSVSGRFRQGVDRYVLWGGLLLSGLLGTVAAVNLYFQVGSVINVWIAGRYQPIFQAGFNLVVLLVAGYVAVRIADRLEVGA